MSKPNQDTDKQVMERMKQQSADEHAKYMAEKMLSEKRQTIIDKNHFLRGRIEELGRIASNLAKETRSRGQRIAELRMQLSVAESFIGAEHYPAYKQAINREKAG